MSQAGTNPASDPVRPPFEQPVVSEAEVARPIKTENITPSNQIATSTQPTCSVATTPTIVSATGTPTQLRPRAEVFFLVANPRGPGVQGIRYPIQAMNISQPNILQANPALLRSINPSQIIRAQTSVSGVLQPQTSQAQTTTMASIQGGHLQIPFSTAGHQGQITLPNGTIVPTHIPIQRHQMLGHRATILQQPTLLRGVGQPRLGLTHSIVPNNQGVGIGVPTSLGQTTLVHHPNVSSSPALPPSQMTPEDALTKGTNFFNSLLTSPKLGPKPKKTIQSIMQALVDGKKTSEEFTITLQRETKSKPNSELIPFLDLFLPQLRQSMIAGTTEIPGIKAPIPQQESSSSDGLNSSNSDKVQSSSSTPSKKKRTPLPPGQKTAYAIKKEAREAKRKERESLAASQNTGLGNDEKKDADLTDKSKMRTDKVKRQDKQKKQEKQLESLSATLRDDDDVNDVAAMGGVNLAEESQRIMASGAELVGTQIRSCRDEPFLDTKSLSARIARIAKEYNLAEPGQDIVTIVSHATQERLKNIVERLGILAEHRCENLKLNPKYEVSNDIKGQMKFLSELDRIEKRRYEEQERELLLRVAKSRSKVEDPEQQKLRQKAKDMQRAEQEEVRQREANKTALLAIGPRKKMKTGTTSSADSFSQSSSLNDIKSVVEIPRGDTIRRQKRVNMRDLQVLLELDRAHLNRLVKITAQ